MRHGRRPITARKQGSRASRQHARTTRGLPRGRQDETREPFEDVFEVEVLNGLCAVARNELLNRLEPQDRELLSSGPDRITFRYKGAPETLLGLRTVIAVFRLVHFRVRHPLKIVQSTNGERLLRVIAALKAQSHFGSFRIGAAGSDSKEFCQIRSFLIQRTGLRFDERDGEMPIRFRRSRLEADGWDVLLRITPRPLSARAWRKENMAGALNATIAAAMIAETEPRTDDCFLNVMCGSGTLLMERVGAGRAARLIGVDSDLGALEKARTNSADSPQEIELRREDARALSLASSSISAACSDLPWGRRIGNVAILSDLYGGVLRELARVCKPLARCVLLTQEAQLFNKELQPLLRMWKVRTAYRVRQADYQPKLFVLERTEALFDETGHTVPRN